MASVKTAVSLDESLFAQVEDLAHEMKVSRSHLVALALEDYVRRRQNRRLIEQINAAYEQAPETEEEKAVVRGMRRRHRAIVEGEWS
jgi:metal-responsive CopG/Arc/MetJ family transcriptional regulator